MTTPSRETPESGARETSEKSSPGAPEAGDAGATDERIVWKIGGTEWTFRRAETRDSIDWTNPTRFPGAFYDANGRRLALLGDTFLREIANALASERLAPPPESSSSASTRAVRRLVGAGKIVVAMVESAYTPADKECTCASCDAINNWRAALADPALKVTEDEDGD